MRAQARDFGARYGAQTRCVLLAPARFAQQTKFLGAMKIKFKRFGILKFCEGEREWTEINRIALGMEFRIKFYEAAGGLNFKI